MKDINRIAALMPPLPEVVERSVVNTRSYLDKNSIELKPHDVDENLHPLSIYGDGNCLPRCGSILAYGTQDKHAEIPLRLLLELAQHRHYYLHRDACTKKTAFMFTMYSQYFHQGKSLTAEVVEEVYNKVVQNTSKMGEYMGLWHMAALASILRRPVISVYPTYGGHTVRNDLQRTFLPRIATSEKEAYIMWTNTRGKTCPEASWIPNHFAVLLPTTIHLSVGVEESSPLDSQCEERSVVFSLCSVFYYNMADVQLAW